MKKVLSCFGFVLVRAAVIVSCVSAKEDLKDGLYANIVTSEGDILLAMIGFIGLSGVLVNDCLLLSSALDTEKTLETALFSDYTLYYTA